jgi:D-xylose 1-dehydrogenase (NADP+, D-xylono-1,5-lactone-forming)
MTTETKKIRWGVLGWARIARDHVIPAIRRASNSEFHALASREPAKLKEGRETFKVPVTYDRYEDLLADPTVDAVYLPLPNALHCEWTIKAAERGKHVLCEKPIALNAAECRRMIAASAANGVRLMEGFMYRYTDRTRQVGEILRGGMLGEIKFVSSTHRFLLANPASIKLKPELGGGALYDVGCYAVNFAGLVADELARQQGLPAESAMPESVAVEQVRAGGVDVNFSALLNYSMGLIASVNCGINSQRRVYSEIIGTRGALEVPDTFLDNAGSLILTLGEERREIPVALSDRYRLEVEDFAGAILAGRAPQFGLTETLRNAEVMDQLMAAGVKPAS